ncbi:MAG: OmpA family protein [Acidihalobacter sp.]|uniref:OmpA family protein n=1 Tax=Acidihalobacter sp. TaxID=1872108 RepID=UPI00307E5DED
MRHISRPALRQLALGIGLALPLSAFAAPGYWVNSAGQTWHNSYGQCWHTGSWTSKNATAACDSQLMPKPKPAPVSTSKPEPTPAPLPKPKPKPKPKMITLNETASGKATMGFNKYAVTPEQAQLLDSQLKSIKDSEVQSVKITGYTDRIGPRAYNMKLSQKRADSVATYIKQHYDISANKIQSVGMGPADPVVQCKGVSGWKPLVKCLAPNRRVTVKVDMVTTKMVPATPTGQQNAN